MKALEKFGNCYFQHFRWAFFQAQCGQKRGCDCGLRTNQDTVVLGLGRERVRYRERVYIQKFLRSITSFCYALRFFWHKVMAPQRRRFKADRSRLQPHLKTHGTKFRARPVRDPLDPPFSSFLSDFRFAAVPLSIGPDAHRNSWASLQPLLLAC